MIEHVRDVDFDSFIGRQGIAIVEFWAEWCPLCKQMESVLQRLDDTYASKVRIAKVNVEHEQATAETYGVQSLPTLLIFREGTLIGRVTGFVPYEALDEALANLPD
ncbi:thioredoxin family protein [Paenibacillus sp.]|uniref:thioredoxin family protein n=1 Tax=Paenibacillus sp. TaxID=58172 RepID=UPI002D22E66C|nr:thioredoxin family protein [Paenibacillus sp.]HZG88456.1 thioredoxin family protein [Paenibacillus sp.]